jgi:fructoselysine 6-phosphate deglycase
LASTRRAHWHCGPAISLLRFGRSENILVLDARELNLDGRAPELAGYFVPLIFFDVLWRFCL